AASTPGVLLLGSIREEDLALITTQPHAVAVRPTLDEALAEHIFERLRAHGQTTWLGWLEPHHLSMGLLMEYVQILTSGQKLQDTISAQIATRLSDVSRHDEL